MLSGTAKSLLNLSEFVSLAVDFVTEGSNSPKQDVKMCLMLAF